MNYTRKNVQIVVVNQSYIHFIGKETTFYSDTCGGQNRNKFVVAELLYTSMNIPSVEIVNHKFFESGNSQMESDSIKVGTNEERVS